MKILITGGIGFVGSRLVPLLQQKGYETAIIDKRKITEEDVECEFFYGNICDQDALNSACEGCDSIVHLAAEYRDDVKPMSLYRTTNVDGTKNVCNAAEKNNIDKIVFTSSVSVYGLNVIGDESLDPQPFNEYGRTKVSAEKILMDWCAGSSSRSLTIVRPTVIYGEGNRGNVYNLIERIHRKKFVMVGRGKNKKSMSYVGNVANFLLTALSFDKGVHIYNYADKPDFDMETLIRIINHTLHGKQRKIRSLPKVPVLLAASCLDILSNMSNKKFSITKERIEKFISDTVVNNSRIKEIGYLAPYDPKEKLIETIKYEFE